MAVVQRGYYSVSVTVCHFGERESFEYVVEKYQYRSYATQPVKEFVMRFRIGKTCR